MNARHIWLPLLVSVTVGSGGRLPLAIAQTSPQIQTMTLPQIKAIEAQKATRTPAQQKMSSQLLDSLAQANTGHAVAGAPALKAPELPVTPEGNVIVDIRGQVSPDLVANIAELGGAVISSFPRFGSIRASMPLENVETLAERPDVQFVQPAARGRTNAINVATEGDIAHTADALRAQTKVRGAGVKVGVLSDSIDDQYGSLQNAFDTGTLDQKLLTILAGQEGAGAGEGLAMAEIIHAIAPDAQIEFATANGGATQMASNIIALRNDGCDIIVDDYTYFIESPFQDGLTSEAGHIGQAVREVSDDGALYFSSARNSGNLQHKTSGTWEGDFSDGGPAGPQFVAAGPNARIHVFANGKTLNTVDKAGSDDRIDLFWSDPLAGSNNGYDLFVVNAAGQVVRSSTTSHTGTQDPYQSIPQLHQGESIVIAKTGSADPRFIHLDTGRAQIRYQTNGSVRGHNASSASHAFSVAAIRVPKPIGPFSSSPSAAVELFSSDGPRRIFFKPDGTPLTPNNLTASGGVILNKPDITAADGVSTSLPPGGLNPFFGTSAAAPHAAAIAALLLSCSPKPSVSKVADALRASAQAIEGSAPNGTAGYGIILAQAAAKGWCNGQSVVN